MASAETLIDARGPAAPATAVPTALEMTLDPRDLGDGKLALAVRATGNGLLGSLSSILAPEVPGFTVAGIDDPGPAVNGLDDDGVRLRPMCDRSWTVRYVPAQARVPDRFVFPTALETDLAVTRRRYEDADVIDAAAEVALAPSQPLMVRLRPWLIAAAVAVIAGLAFILARRRRRTLPVGPSHRLPAVLTPFNVLGALTALRDDPAAGLDAQRRATLAKDIADLERRLFSREAEGGPDAERVARAWLANAS